MKLEFRDLTKDDVEVRVAMARKNGVSLLIYKDARTDQDILDEAVGKLGWKKSYQVIKDNLYCTIAIKDTDTGEWVEKQDCGVESNTEKEKGEASDSQKRAGFVWGIGRELYTAPFIWVDSAKCEIVESNGKFQCKTPFQVSRLDIKDKKIVGLDIVNAKSGEVVFSFGNKVATKKETKKEEKVELATDEQKEYLKNVYKDQLPKLLEGLKVKSIDEITKQKATEIIFKVKGE